MTTGPSKHGAGEAGSDHGLSDGTEDSVPAIKQRLHDHEERLAAILNTAVDAIITIDRAGTILSVNPSTTRMFQYQPEEMIGNNVSMLMPTPFREQHSGYIERYLETGEARVIGIGREASALRKDGSVFPVDLAISEVDHLRLFTGIIRDKTARKALERDVLRIAEEEDRRIGHELHDGIQQEIAAMAMFANAMIQSLDVADPVEVGGRKHRLLDQQRFDELQATAHRLLNGLSDAQSHIQRLARGIVPLQIDSQGLQNALAALASAINVYEGVECRFETRGPVILDGQVTATHLYRIAQEAVNNALRHSSADEIRISLCCVAGRLLLEVADNGIGMGLGPIPQDSGTGSEGIGIRAMHYRANLVDALLEIVPRDGGGTLVRCSLASGCIC